MKNLSINELENIQGGDLVDGLCGGLLGAEGLVGVAYLAGTWGWIAPIPFIGQAAIAVGAAAALTCAISTID